MAQKKKTNSAKKAKPATKEMLLVGTKTKDVLRGLEMNVASDALDSLNELVHWYLDQAAKRAQANGRKTVRGYDFIAC